MPHSVAVRPPAGEQPDRFKFEKECLAQGHSRLAGIDEAGRGPLAGPVVAAAVILPLSWIRNGMPSELRGLNDSKQLTESQRDDFSAFLSNHPEVEKGVAFVDPPEIDRINILKATHRAMALALSQLEPEPNFVLIDGRPVPHLKPAQRAIVSGDALSFSIAAASVLAKVARDRRMFELDNEHPEYGFAIHKGYGTPAHLAALTRHGPSPVHRMSFAPCRLQQLELL